ncbi:N6-adenosine-methyltransferase subunit METTL3 isoform X2 [Daktulosphaira vitifoliae]|uniref:N6-adenosine-methyltransferase subunit METTL3 isoform X2 n=1 Tax=Daktulosphaira vitifoliae TaxID=58002 RepID=UPI0021AA6377|nr:N6-adenosine-methyltransferase subunit METTL3 isoform X2 [Daktulosphaira vitifoliae]
MGESHVTSENSYETESNFDWNQVGGERVLLEALIDVSLNLPVTSNQLVVALSKKKSTYIPHSSVINLLHKFVAQNLISLENIVVDGQQSLQVLTAEHAKCLAMINDLSSEADTVVQYERSRLLLEDKIKQLEEEDINESLKKSKIPKLTTEKRNPEDSDDDIMSLISMPSTREKEFKKVSEEIMELLNKPTAKEKSLAERFRSKGGTHVMEFCPHGTRSDCMEGHVCKKLHFKKIIQQHTDESLGDCSFLNTCFHMDTCKYVHYEVDGVTSKVNLVNALNSFPAKKGLHPDKKKLAPPLCQWIQCDLRFMDFTFLGKFAVIMADPPWDIHMELPYGTMSDDEMRRLGIPQLQDDGLIFLWVTGRAMELGRECLKLWGYKRVDEIIWVKTNQLQRIIRTGRTGHWLNHGKEHCLVGMKGKPANLNCGLDCDVIVAEVRDTSHKPDEIYGIIERLSPGTRKIELFGRAHNIQPNWITLGNQVEGIRLTDQDLIEKFKKAYPSGSCLTPLKRNT